ncbi:cytochrome o ubiquinol oxidase subunit IV, partial [Serratia marcescens]|uniref:cytochrome o ubiquinol oxidase subunit IV n=1 Tax=Serratia marcescens TaxID=615 RepID=UPI0013DB71E7
VALTAVPFYLVMSGVIDSKQIVSAVVIVCAVVQIVVHMVCFLHMDAKSEGGWTLMALIFTVIIVVITLAGSLWVMY